jgi:hypothetical protein
VPWLVCASDGTETRNAVAITCKPHRALLAEFEVPLAHTYTPAHNLVRVIVASSKGSFRIQGKFVRRSADVLAHDTPDSFELTENGVNVFDTLSFKGRRKVPASTLRRTGNFPLRKGFQHCGGCRTLQR